MAYIITKTNGDALITVPDTERNDSYGVTLVGRNYSGYGVFLNDNFVRLMENFANEAAPATPLDGQLWFNTTTKNLNLWQGSAWKLISYLTNSGTEPESAGRKIGDLWWDNTNYQLKTFSGETVYTANAAASSAGNVLTLSSTTNLVVDDSVTHANISALSDIRISQILNATQLRISSSATVSIGETVTFTRGSGWYTIGPVYTRGQKVNGYVPIEIIDTQGIAHVATLVYSNGEIIGLFSKDPEYIPRTADAISGFVTVKPGIQLRESGATSIAKTSLSYSVGSSGTTLIELSDNSDLVVGDYYYSANVSISSYLSITELYPNNNISISGVTSVYPDEPIIFQRGVAAVNLFEGTATNTQKFNNKPADAFAQLAVNNSFAKDITIAGNLYFDKANLSLTHVDGSYVLKNIVSGANLILLANVPTVSGNTQVLNLNGVTGLFTVRADPTEANGIATKNYVDTVDGTTRSYLASNVTAIINGAPAGRRSFGEVSDILTDVYANLGFLTSSVDLRAYAQDSVLTGVPVAPTAPVRTSNTQIATTAFVTTRVDSDTAAMNANLAAANAQINLRATIASPSFTGIPTTAYPYHADESNQISSTAWVRATIANLDLSQYATLSSPTFINIPAAPTANISANTTQLATTAFIHRVLPAGMIIMWSGSVATIPYGWQLCDGTNGSPNLRNKFIVGAGDTYNPAAVGGAVSVTGTTANNGAHSHTGNVGSTAITIAQMPSHTHPSNATFMTYSGSGVPGHQSFNQYGATSLTVANTGGGQGHTHTVSTDGTHNHSVSISTLPPYYALCYIIKVI